MKPADNDDQDLRPEYDFSKGTRGKYAKQYTAGSNVVVLDPDVAAQFPTSEAVNDALRKELDARKKAGGA